MSNYKLSVITPFHNVDLHMFDNTVKSMLKQNIGFENIQWVIVVHNSEDSYYDAVMERLSDYKNVVIKRISNSCHTPSSPRNEGLKLAEGEYISFLDGDDMYNPDSAQKIIQHLDNTVAQILVFRREYELESQNMVPITETTPINETFDEIVLSTKDCAMDNRIYNDFPFFVTSRAFRRDFIVENDFSFDEDISIGEDCYFNLEAIGKADKICFTPSFIGYRYYINSQSLLSASKTDAEILKVASDSVRIFKKSLDIGNYTNTIILSQAFVMARYLADPSVTTETRLAVKEMFEPYLLSAKPLPKGRFPEPMNSLINTLPYDIILNVSKFDKIHNGTFIDDGSSVLYDILRNNEKTDMGKRYHFDDIFSIIGYQSVVPKSDIRSYEPFIKLCMQINEKKIFCADEIKWYCKDDTGRFLPVTAHQESEFVTVLENSIEGQNIMFWHENPIGTTARNDGICITGMFEMALCAYLNKHRYGRDVILTVPECVIPNAYIDNATYFNMTLSLLNREVEQVIMPVAFDLASFMSFIEENITDIADDIEKGDFSKQINLNDYQKKIVSAFFYKDAERAEELRKIAKADGPIKLKDIWPRLKQITLLGAHFVDDSIKGINVSLDEISVVSKYVLTPYGLIAKKTDKEDEYELVRDSIFYEFSPKEAGNEGGLLRMDEVEPGQKYDLYITTSAGLYRFRSNLSVEIVSMEANRVIVRF